MLQHAIANKQQLQESMNYGELAQDNNSETSQELEIAPERIETEMEDSGSKISEEAF
jgi:hypothetical protein